ncbi:MAG: class I SAM-dependent methyltransferase, partial [Chloroflexi bacterium]|nr:class I SAM-dependent methyltransferase [Chloroflexota bacterium]
RAALRTERDDGRAGEEDVSWYFTRPREFPRHERTALHLACGRVLDLGCGAGRHALYLQGRGLSVTAIDKSPRIVELARTRGVEDARVADVCRRLPFRDGEFDTVILFGNNLAICGTQLRFRHLLRELHRVTGARGRILGTTRQPNTTELEHLGYLRKNLAGGRAAGQIRMRLAHRGHRGAWFDLLLMSPIELLQAAAREKWELAAVWALENLEEGYAALLEKRR